ncbi:hypothetical protein COU95_00010 [Candidatus Shapirobacteria bacterium CG10_big_fil_rev_8_21_14_0_10_40_9]|uniref:Metallo-beta-lactamase domain-containing protein n=1 Tax=Candidatus Shapirobacteria bacterium CG10_big_fil_rev_8_21_14_0_10_40_9 TaxID=1974888 RepID=A0A2M8L4L1_9BACT|nr:MAG: hypothetical protein COU95_00010 [Candidatus Shapirobacteria bacterium CG10_big_fil_rev_8_21_14_0_10_40_9]
MEIEKVVVGPLATNCYIVSEKNEAIVIDPGGEPEKIFSVLPTTNLTHIILTHAHPDHLGALSALKNEFPKAKFLIHKGELPILKSLHLKVKPDGFLNESKLETGNKQSLLLRNWNLEILHTPGHSPGGICFKVGDFLFTGDTLFAEGVGRTDYPFSSQKDLIKSLKKLGKLPKDLKIYPGHGQSSTLHQALGRLSGLLPGF